MQKQYVRFQMKNSTRPQTIAEVFRDVDIQSFRSNPEWYEIIEAPVLVDNIEDKATKPAPIKKAGRPRKEKQQ